MSPGQMLPGQMTVGNCSKDVPRNLHLKFDKKKGSVAAEILLTLSLCGGVGGGMYAKSFMSSQTKVMLG